jgi:hypothetical protein
MAINEPRPFRLARCIVIACLIVFFLVIIAFNINRHDNAPPTVKYLPKTMYRAPLPSFTILPSNNNTMFQALNCTTGTDLDIAPYNTTRQIVSNGRYYRQHALAMYQAALPYLNDHPSSKDEYDYAGRAFYNASRQMDDYMRIHDISNTSSIIMQVRHAFEDLLGANGTFNASVVSKDRWGAYTINSPLDAFDQRSWWDLDNYRFQWNDKVAEMTCILGSPVRIETKDAMATDFSVSSMTRNASWMAELVSGQSEDSTSRKVQMFKGMNTIISYRLDAECRHSTVCFVCSDFYRCVLEHSIASVNSVPMMTDLVPEAFSNVSNIQDYAMVTIQLIRDGGGSIPYTVIAYETSYGWLEMLASIFSAFSILLLVYKLLMGDGKLDPFGWVQKRILVKTTKAFVEHVKESKDDEWLENVLFAFYIKANGISELEEEGVDVKQRMRGLMQRLRRTPPV